MKRFKKFGTALILYDADGIFHNSLKYDDDYS
jgi:hypothetical protein